MTDMTITVSVALVIAIIAGELFSVLWYDSHTPWGHHWGDRYLLSAIVSDVGLAWLLQQISSHYWSLRKWEDAAMLSAWLTLLYACLEAPHVVHNSKSFSRFFFHAAHKFLLMFIMSACLWHFKDY